MNDITQIIIIVTLCAPLAYAVIEDRNGDKHPNNDWMIIGLFMLVASIVSAFIDGRFNFWFNLFRSFMLSFGIYVLLFDYIVSIVLVMRGTVEGKINPLKHFSDTAIPDKWAWWRAIGWGGRLFVKAWVFAVCYIVYFCPCKIADYNQTCMICQ